MTRTVGTITFALGLAMACSSSGGSSATVADGGGPGSGGASMGAGGASASDASKFVGLWKATRQSGDGPCNMEPTQWTPSSNLFPYVSFEIDGAVVQEYRCNADMSCTNGPLGMGTYRFTDGIWTSGLHLSASGSPPCTAGTEEYRVEFRGATLRQIDLVQSAPGTERSGECSFEAAGPYVCVSESVTEFEYVGP